MKVNIPLTGRTFVKTQGCWNCVHRADPAVSLKFWRENGRPLDEARLNRAKTAIMEAAPPNMDPNAVVRIKTPVNQLCPCGSGAKYKRCHRDRDQMAASTAKQIEAVEQGYVILENFELSITSGHPILGMQGLCTNPRAPQGGGFKAHNFLCDQWTGAQGASVARAGEKADLLPEELKDIHGDGT